MSQNSVMKAIQKHVNKVADEMREEDERIQREQCIQAREQMAPTYRSAWLQPTTTTITTSGSTNINSTSWAQYVQPHLGGAPLNPFGNIGQATNVYKYPPTISFTSEQMSQFMDKLAALLSKGWECIRCHRVLSPQEPGCEFCNLIDRLEGKDVERDSAA